MDGVYISPDNWERESLCCMNGISLADSMEFTIDDLCQMARVPDNRNPFLAVS